MPDAEMYCENCDAFRPFWSEPYHAPLTDAPEEQGFLFSDQVCTVCRSIIATARKPLPTPAIEKSSWRESIEGILWLAVMAAMVFVYYKF